MEDIIISPTQKISIDREHLVWVVSEKVRQKKGKEHWRVKRYYPYTEDVVCSITLGKKE